MRCHGIECKSHVPPRPLFLQAAAVELNILAFERAALKSHSRPIMQKQASAASAAAAM